MSLISLKHVSKRYGDQRVLNDIDLTVDKGQILGLVGPNGAGKTTCLHALLGLTSFDGDIDVLGHNPRRQRSDMLKHVSYISDVAVLPKWITARQAIAYMQGVHPRFSASSAEYFLSKTNIPVDKIVSQLSKGMVTQLHLALILAIDAQVLVLDEPTIGLDILTRRQFYNHLLEDFYESDKCIVVTTHQIEEIEHILTHVAFISNGQIILTDAVETVKQRFVVVTVDHSHASELKNQNPLYVNNLMGLTSMLFDKKKATIDASIGKISTPSLADIFVGLMGKENTL